MKKIFLVGTFLLTTSLSYAMDPNEDQKPGQDARTAEQSEKAYSAWEDLNATQLIAQGIRDRIVAMNQNGIGGAELQQLKKDTIALVLSKDLQKAHKRAKEDKMKLLLTLELPADLAKHGICSSEHIQTLGEHTRAAVRALLLEVEKFDQACHALDSLIDSVRETFPESRNRGSHRIFVGHRDAGDCAQQ